MAHGPQRMAFIDSLRLLAASLVLVQHWFEGRPGVVRTWLIPLAPGVAGVAIFFFISGYVIPMAARGGLDLRAFVIRRLFRIYPLYLTVIALMVIAGATGFIPFLHVIAQPTAAMWIANILLVAEFVHVPMLLGVSWTLTIELIWYALFAASIVVFGKRAADRLDIFVPVTFMAMTLASLIVDSRIPLGRPTMIYAAVIGFQCFRFQNREIGAGRLARSVMVFACVALIGNYVAFGVFTHPTLTLFQAIMPWIAATALFLTGVLWRPVRDAAVLNAGLLPAIGATSYSIYLLHPIVTLSVARLFPEAMRLPLDVVVVFGLSWLSFRLIEQPGIALGRAVAAGRRGRVAQVSLT